ncbi:hypothetical protein AWB70_00526 [Caballeronia cordobensis]|uniref:Uncharacterized protein n=1 Tax=Caballeronia cordobensis TaxID=1353886 RepID=A0A158F3F9_CABCO|nr:hypothetical protein AWB70_00526 [Caballeronia cordobensis]
MAGRLKFTSQGLFPATAVIHLFPDYTGKVTGNFQRPALERTHPFPPETPNEIAQFKEDILPGSRLGFAPLRASSIVGRQQHHGEMHIAVRLNLFDHRAPLIGLFVQDDWLEVNSFEEAGDSFARSSVVSMNDKYPSRQRRLP